MQNKILVQTYDALTFSTALLANLGDSAASAEVQYVLSSVHASCLIENVFGSNYDERKHGKDYWDLCL